jgi:glycerate 2-kinase
VARSAGCGVRILGDSIEGEAHEVGQVVVGIARQVTMRGNGKGGRNVEFLLLAPGLALKGQPHVYAMARDTDGVDGLEETAGALLMPDTLNRAHAQGLDPAESLDSNDGHGFFGALREAVIAGPTLINININDFRAVLIEPAGGLGHTRGRTLRPRVVRHRWLGWATLWEQRPIESPRLMTAERARCINASL